VGPNAGDKHLMENTFHECLIQAKQGKAKLNRTSTCTADNNIQGSERERQPVGRRKGISGGQPEGPIDGWSLYGG